jgi:hypothetical protein
MTKKPTPSRSRNSEPVAPSDEAAAFLGLHAEAAELANMAEKFKNLLLSVQAQASKEQTARLSDGVKDLRRAPRRPRSATAPKES